MSPLESRKECFCGGALLCLAEHVRLVGMVCAEWITREDKPGWLCKYPARARLAWLKTTVVDQITKHQDMSYLPNLGGPSRQCVGVGIL